MPALFAITLFVSATLLFLVQPMIGKMLLPKFGGAPNVWNSCMVFFQVALLAGYAYAHVSTTWLGVRRQAAAHLLLLLLPFLFLPIVIDKDWHAPPEDYPIGWLLYLLLLTAGVPFFVIASSAPLLQRWFASTGEASAQDPYYLYAASNLGSMVALLGYPLLVEPFFRLQLQSWIWAVGYGVLVALTLACAVAVWRAPASKGLRAKAKPVETGAGAVAMTPWTRAHWVALAFVPSSLMLGATTYMSTDLSPIPLLWVIPLALYLLSFILVFSRLPSWVDRTVLRLMPLMILLQCLFMILGGMGKISVVVPMHLATLFLVSMACHGELARTRPTTEHLTEFYIWMSVGGALGGMFNALLAPVIFSTVAEYPLALVLACLLMPRRDPSSGTPLQKFLDYAIPVVFFLMSLQFAGLWELSSADWFVEDLRSWVEINPQTPAIYTVRAALQWGIPLLVCLAFVKRPIRLGLALGSIFIAHMLHIALMSASREQQTVFQARSFFGTIKIESLNDGNVAQLSHGTTLHGAQLRSDDPRVRLLQITYYWPTGPIGQLFDALEEMGRRQPVAVIGLGTGTLAAYCKEKQQFTFFDIDQKVIDMASDMQYFTFLTEIKGEKRIVLGDARLSLEKEPDGSFGLMIMDAFSSDAIPVHLVTHEALQLYLRKLTPDGILVFHISNKFLDLQPIMANLAAAENLICLAQMESQMPFSTAETKYGRMCSDWVVMARKEKDFGMLARNPLWKQLPPRPDKPLWTDDFSNVLSIIKWR